ncbi:MAG: riboflavin synthase [Candidatus Omnitrophota bacterium]|jgi:riboflavin synthase
MFTGIVEELGVLRRRHQSGRVMVIEVSADKTLQGASVGESIAVNGACLTVVQLKKDALVFEVMSETLKSTNIGLLKTGEQVNLERSLKAGDRISGHFVTGHIDCLGLVRKKSYLNNNLVFQIAVKPEYLRYCLPKGSICVDGISLTLAAKTNSTFSVYLIPHTLKNTTLNFKGPSSRVNVEFDILAKKDHS